MTDDDLALITLLSTVDLASVVNTPDWVKQDGTPLTDTEREQVAGARLEHLLAARDLLALDVQMETES